MKTTMKAALLVSVLSTVLMAQAVGAKDTSASTQRSDYYKSERTVYSTNPYVDVNSRSATYNRDGSLNTNVERTYHRNRDCNTACLEARNPVYTYGREAHANRIGGNDNDSNNRNRYLAVSSPSAYKAQTARVVKH